MQFRLIRRIAGRARIIDVHDLCVTRHDDRHAVLVTDRRDAANEALLFGVGDYKALTVSRALYRFPPVVCADVLDEKRFEGVHRIDDQRLIPAGVGVEVAEHGKNLVE